MCTHCSLQWQCTLPNLDCGVVLLGDTYELSQFFLFDAQVILCHMSLQVLFLQLMQVLMLPVMKHREKDDVPYISDSNNCGDGCVVCSSQSSI